MRAVFDAKSYLLRIKSKSLQHSKGSWFSSTEDSIIFLQQKSERCFMAFPSQGLAYIGLCFNISGVHVEILSSLQLDFQSFTSGCEDVGPALRDRDPFSCIMLQKYEKYLMLRF